MRGAASRDRRVSSSCRRGTSGNGQETIHELGATLSAYVQNGGSLFVFQPNPYPSGRARIELLPAWFEVENQYIDDAVDLVDPDHPIVRGLAPNELPYPADRISATSPEWRILARGRQSHQGSLAVAELGKGRVALDTDHPMVDGRAPPSNSGTQSDRCIARIVAWLRHR